MTTWFIWIGALVLVGVSCLFALAHIGYWSGAGYSQTEEESYADYQDRLAEQRLSQEIDRPWTFLGYCGLVFNGLGLLLLISRPDLQPLLWSLLVGNLLFQSISFACRVSISRPVENCFV